MPTSRARRPTRPSTPTSPRSPSCAPTCARTWTSACASTTRAPRPTCAVRATRSARRSPACTSSAPRACASVPELALDLPAILDDVAARAPAVDEGAASPYDALRALAAGGGLVEDLGAMAGTIAALSERCMATGFVTWAHRISLEYLDVAG